MAVVTLMSFDYWYYNRAERAVSARAAYEKAQAATPSNGTPTNGTGSSEGDMGDPWA